MSKRDFRIKSQRLFYKELNMAKDSNKNIFSKKYGYVQLINGENLIGELSPSRKIKEKDSEGNVIDETKIYKIKYPYKISEIFHRGGMKLVMIRWNPHIDSEEFVIDDSNIMLLERQISPAYVFRYLQCRFIAGELDDDVSMVTLESDYLDYLYNDPEKYHDLLEAYTKEMNDLVKDSEKFIDRLMDRANREEKNRRDQENYPMPDENYEEGYPPLDGNNRDGLTSEEYDRLKEEAESMSNRSYRHRKRRKHNSMKNRQLNKVLCNKIIECFGSDSAKWIFDS